MGINHDLSKYNRGGCIIIQIPNCNSLTALFSNYFEYLSVFFFPLSIFQIM